MDVTCNVEDGIAQVRLNRPDKLNSLTLPLLRELTQTAHGLAKDKNVRAVVIGGEGRTFCAGLDFASVMSDRKGVLKTFAPRPWRKGGTNDFQEAVWALRSIPAPVIAAVHGHCLGGGVQIALGADFRYATPDSTWSVLEGKWGIIPDMTGIQSLSEVVGIDVAKRLTMTSEMFSGDRAHQLGLVTEISEDPVAAATGFAQELLQRSPDALAAAKRLFDDTWHATPRRTFRRERREQVALLRSENAKIARVAGLKKEAPVFQPRER